jgi:surface protein
MRISDLHRRIISQPLPSEFIIIVKTDNIGVSASNEMLLPIAGTNMVIDWGDGNTSTHTQTNTPNNTIGGSNVLHTYQNAGVYQIKISPSIDRIFFNNGGDRSKLIEIKNWGKAIFNTFFSAFFGCNNLITGPTNKSILNVTANSLSRSFSGCSSLSYLDVSRWNTSNITTFLQTFINCSSLTTLDTKNWDTSSVTIFQNTFQNCSNLNTMDVSNWNVSNVVDFNFCFYICNLQELNCKNWELRKAGVRLDNIFRNSSIPCDNYTDNIVSWANYIKNNGIGPLNVSMITQAGRVFATSRSGGENFTTAGDARNFLTSSATYPDGAGWTISGDTVRANC